MMRGLLFPLRRGARRLRRPAPCAALGLLACLVLASCVERTLEIRTRPPGAAVTLDREPRGTTPLVLPFAHYGAREVAVELEGYEPERRVVALRPPWFQIFPLDFLFECLCPFTLRDRRDVEFRLRRSAPADEEGEARRDALLGRAGQARRDAGAGESSETRDPR